MLKGRAPDRAAGRISGVPLLVFIFYTLNP